MIESTYSRFWLIGDTQINVHRIRFTVIRSNLTAQLRISGEWDGFTLTGTFTSDGEWEGTGHSAELLRAMGLVAPIAISAIRRSLDDALAELIPIRGKLTSNCFVGGWAVCDLLVDPRAVVATGETATDARIAVMCSRGPEGQVKGLVAREIKGR